MKIDFLKQEICMKNIDLLSKELEKYEKYSADMKDIRNKWEFT